MLRILGGKTGLVRNILLLYCYIISGSLKKTEKGKEFSKFRG